METINLQWLKDHKACAPARRVFRRRWGDAGVPLADVLLALAEHSEGPTWWDWLGVEHPALGFIFQQYYDISEPIYQQHFAAAGPFYEKYWTAHEDLVGQLRSGKLTQEQFEDADQSVWNARESSLKPFRDKCNAVFRAELRKLATAWKEMKGHGQAL